MTEPTIICPKCKTEIKLTESLAAPLVAATRKEYEQLIANKDTAIALREKEIHAKEDVLRKEREALESTIEEKLKAETTRIAKEESKKAKLEVSADIEEKQRIV